MLLKITLPNLNFSENIAAVREPLTTDEERILAYLTTNEYIIRGDVDKLLGVSQSTSNRILRRMVERRMIAQDGAGKNTKYIKR